MVNIVIAHNLDTDKVDTLYVGCDAEKAEAAFVKASETPVKESVKLSWFRNPVNPMRQITVDGAHFAEVAAAAKKAKEREEAEKAALKNAEALKKLQFEQKVATAGKPLSAAEKKAAEAKAKADEAKAKAAAEVPPALADDDLGLDGDK